MDQLEKEIEEVEKEIKNTPYNKSTEKHIGRLKAKLAKLKEEKRMKAEKQPGGGGGYAVEKSGDATVILVGFPSVGKSTLLNSLTGADSEVADYEFTTLEVTPGTLKYNGADIQILDIPGIISGASEGKGRGREVMSILRNADLLLLMIDPFELDQYEQVKDEIYSIGIRVNEEPPNVRIEERESGGLNIQSPIDLDLGEEEIKSILQENGIINADVVIRENLDSERLIDAIMGNRKYVPAFVLINKMDLVSDDQFKDIQKYVRDEIEEDVHYISALEDDLETLKDRIFNELNLIRVYLKPRGGEADMDEPLILRKGVTVKDLCREIHRDLLENFRYAQVWGDSAEYPGQEVGKDHELSDEDIVRVFS